MILGAKTTSTIFVKPLEGDVLVFIVPELFDYHFALLSFVTEHVGYCHALDTVDEEEGIEEKSVRKAVPISDDKWGNE